MIAKTTIDLSLSKDVLEDRKGSLEIVYDSNHMEIYFYASDPSLMSSIEVERLALNAISIGWKAEKDEGENEGERS